MVGDLLGEGATVVHMNAPAAVDELDNVQYAMTRRATTTTIPDTYGCDRWVACWSPDVHSEEYIRGIERLGT